jgi:hypothetical protein
MSRRKLSIPLGSMNVLSNRGFLTDSKTELDRMGVPKSLRPKGRYNKSKWLFTRMEVQAALQKGY